MSPTRQIRVRAVPSPRLRLCLPAVAALALVVPAGASGATARTLEGSKLLWSTINVCDTATRPNAIGLRASMPGDGDAATEMFMRFQVQYFTPKDGSWRNLATGGDSGFVDVGSSRFTARETGRLFTFSPAAGRSYQLRGVVSFEWRRAGVAVRRSVRRTSVGHKSAAGADPPGYSAATCTIA